MDAPEPYRADPSLRGRLRRRLVRLQHRRPAPGSPGRAMVSFAFDDAPTSAFAAGADILERRGARGTYFVCAGLAGRVDTVGLLGDREAMRRVADRGHEIGCHTFSHLDCGRADGETTEADLARNGATLAGWGLGRPETFAYPYGDVGPRAKRRVAARYALGRALHPGLVRRGSDLAQAPAVGIEGENGEALAHRWLDVAHAEGGWLVLFTHGVEPGPTRYGCTVAAFDRLVGRAKDEGFDIVTVAEGARRMRAAA